MAVQRLSKIRKPIGTVGRRRALHRFTASVPRLDLPAWFDPMRDTLLITSVAPGGGSAASDGTTYGATGAAGAATIRLPVKLLPTTRALEIVIGAAGAGGVAGAGGTGGTIFIRDADAALTALAVYGGKGGRYAFNDADVDVGATVAYLDTHNPNGRHYLDDTAASGANGGILAKLSTSFLGNAPEGIVQGLPGYAGTLPASVALAVGTGLSTTAAIPTIFGGGNPGTGYGYGAMRPNALTPTNGNPGGPGVVVLEFVEE